MKQQRYTTNVLTAPSKVLTGRPFLPQSRCLILELALLFLIAALPRAMGESAAIRFTTSPVRVTVPIGTTNVNFITNIINLALGASNANFDVTLSGLPATVRATLTDTNGNPLLSTTQDTNLVLTLYTTNIAQGLYPFSLNAGGFDTNGVPLTNSFPFLLQAAHIWNGSLGVSNNWATASSWRGGIPGAADDAVFLDAGAQTNISTTTGIGLTNVGVDVNTTVGSIRFAQTYYVDPGNTVTNTESYTVKIANGATLFVTGTNGFSVLRDYIGERANLDRTLRVDIIGTNATLFVSNSVAPNFSVLVGNQQQPTLSMSNLSTFVGFVNRMAPSEYQVYPNYRAINAALNAGRDTNTVSDLPGRFVNNIFLARTNFITALYHDADNYNNEFTRGYGVSFLDSEQQGTGSSVVSTYFFGSTNIIRAEGVCFSGANHAATVRFNPYFATSGNIQGAVFRGTNGSSRMTVFTVSDDGGTNEATSNVKATVDLAANNGYVDILADRLYVARDRTLISSNQTPNVQGDLTIGKGIVDVNTAIFGYQEHSNKVDWTTLYGTQPYLNYCRGTLTLTNGGTFRVNGTLTLGYTADNNPVGSAQQYNTWGQITVYSNCTVSANNIIIDSGLNFYDSNHRQNSITLNQLSTLIVSNSIGGAPGLKLDFLTVNGATNVLFLTNGITPITCRQLQTPGVTPSTIRIAALGGVTSFPAQLPIISYEGSASPFMVADVSALGTNFFGYILNNSANNTVDLFITTNAPNNLLWRGNISGDWDSSTMNWVKVPGSTPAAFTLGDMVTFDDSASTFNVNVVNSVVPSQTGTGVTITNNLQAYVFSGGTIAGTALLVKSGTNNLTFTNGVVEQGPLRVFAGSVSANGTIGATTIAANTLLSVSSSVNGGITSTGTVIIASSGGVLGPMSLQGGSLDNSGTITTTPGGIAVAPGVFITNELGATFNVALAWDLPTGATLANFGNINNAYQASGAQNFTCEGLLFGTGSLSDGSLGGSTSSNGRSIDQGVGFWSPGAQPYNSIGTLTFNSRIDINNNNPAGLGISTIRIEFDFANSQTNDIIAADKWNNFSGPMILMTNINPLAGTFQLGQIFQVFSNNNGVSFPNITDTLGYYPLLWPPTPGPNLQWGINTFGTNGQVTITNSALVWNGTPGSTWSTNTGNANWKGGIDYYDNGGAVFDESAAASGPVTVNIAGVVGPMGFMTVTDMVVGSYTNIFTNNPVMAPGIIVSNSTKPYIFAGSGKISGMTGIYKTGPGSLTIINSTNNTFNGDVIIDNGTLVLTNVPGQGVASIGAQVSANNRNNELIIDGATVNYVGLTNANIPNITIINSRGATLQVSSPTNEFTLNGVILANGQVGTLTKTGPGVLVLTSGSDGYSGGTVISAGAVRLQGPAAGYGPISPASNILQATNTGNATITITNTMNVASAGSQIQVLGPQITNMVFSGPWLGSGGVTLSTSNQFTWTSGGLSNFSGTLSLGNNSGIFTFNNATNSTTCRGSAAATFDLGIGSAILNNLNGSNATYNLGALMGGAGTILSGRSTNSAAPPGTTYSIGANGASTTFSGRITDGLDVVTLVKVGAGTLNLNGTNTSTGSITVSNGTLGGKGVISGPLTVTAGGTLSPGTSIGTFTVSNSATFAGTLLMELNQTNAPASNDLLVVTGTITGGGSLVVTNIGPDIINGSSFKLFNKAVTGFSVSLPATSPGGSKPYVWQNNLGVDGSIKLLNGGAPVNTNPTNITFSLSSGTNLSLGWPSDHIGWALMSNSIGLPLTNAWFLVPGSQLTNQELLNADTSKTNVFFRMSYP